jgi:hypothetical protein
MILQRTDDPSARADNNIKFVLLRQPLSDLLPPTTVSEATRQAAIDDLVAEIEMMTRSSQDDRWRVRVVNQGRLTLEGWEFKEEETEPPAAWDGNWELLRQMGGSYQGAKWSVYLRAPDLFFELLDTFSERLVLLRDVATIKYGIKSGADKFFYVQDVTDTLNNTTLAKDWGLTHDQTVRVRVVKAGDGSAHLVEAEYLKPLIFNVMELDGPRLDETTLRKKILLVSGSKESLKGTHVLNYISYGERAGYSGNITCQARIIPDKREWYELKDSMVDGDAVWPKAHQYRHIVTFNPDKLPINCRLYAIKGQTHIDPKLLGAILNSTLVIWLKELYGRVVGREGNTDTMVFEVKQIPIVNPTLIPSTVADKLKDALDR